MQKVLAKILSCADKKKMIAFLSIVDELVRGCIYSASYNCRSIVW